MKNDPRQEGEGTESDTNKIEGSVNELKISSAMKDLEQTKIAISTEIRGRTTARSKTSVSDKLPSKRVREEDEPENKPESPKKTRSAVNRMSSPLVFSIPNDLALKGTDPSKKFIIDPHNVSVIDPQESLLVDYEVQVKQEMNHDVAPEIKMESMEETSMAQTDCSPVMKDTKEKNDDGVKIHQETYEKTPVMIVPLSAPIHPSNNELNDSYRQTPNNPKDEMNQSLTKFEFSPPFLRRRSLSVNIYSANVPSSEFISGQSEKSILSYQSVESLTEQITEDASMNHSEDDSPGNLNDVTASLTDPPDEILSAQESPIIKQETSNRNEQNETKHRKPSSQTAHLSQKICKPRLFFGCSKIEEYDIKLKIGEGTFGEVSQARHKRNGKMYALKKILMHNEKEGVPITALREIKILKSLIHVNVIGLSEISFLRGDRTIRERGTLFMVFPYMDHDLAGLLENPVVKFNESQIKCYVHQLLEGTCYLHKSRILHRDMKAKASNILIDNSGNLRLADFGLARGYLPEKPDKDYTNCVVTRWYRPPELLLGVTKYSEAIDLWGVGCVIGEIYKRHPILPGQSDMAQLEIIFELCGSPTKENWPDVQKLPTFAENQASFNQRFEKRLYKRFAQFSPLAIDLVDRLLKLDPSKRISAEQALEHPYFWKKPFPANPNTTDFNPFPSSHEYSTRKDKMDKLELFRNIEGANHLKQPEPHFADPEIMQMGEKALMNEFGQTEWHLSNVLRARDSK